MRLGRVLGVSLWAWSFSTLAAAEGSAELDLNETPWNGSSGFFQHDQAISTDTILRVDILNGGAEKICWRGNGSLALRGPDGTTLLDTLTAGSCLDAATGVTGAYYAALSADQDIGTEWDVRVCAGSVSDAACLNQADNERTGRLWSSSWSFQESIDFRQRYSINGSLYAVVPGGAVGRDAVVEMQMRGVSGARYVLRANSSGTATEGGARIGRSVPTAGNSVTPEYPLYLNPPEAAQYNWTAPQIGSVTLTAGCGSGVVLSRASGAISFTSNVTGQYVVVCDVNRDSIHDFAGNADFSSFGAAQVGTNTVTWNGRDNAGADAAEGSYSCVVRLNVGEFHYVAEDIETAYPGIRMYRLEADKTTRTPLRMFWDDSDISAGEPMPNAQASPRSPLADGLDPKAYADAWSAFYFAGGDRTQPDGNARAWGDFDITGAGKGNNAFLDQFAAADSALSAPLSVSVLRADSDTDADGLTGTRECDLGSHPQQADSDGDGIHDGFEAPAAGDAPDTDGDALIDVLDPDDDGDGVATSIERGALENGDGNPADAANSDGTDAPDYLDTDSDDDGVGDASDSSPRDDGACADTDGDGCDDCANGRANPDDDGPDADGDGRCDGDATGDGGPDEGGGDGGNDASVGVEDAGSEGGPGGMQPPHGTLSGGALCAVAAPGAPRRGGCCLWLFALAGSWLWRRRASLLRRIPGALALLAALFVPTGARAQVALDQFKPAPLASDGFGLSRPELLEKLSWSALVWLDYANDPLVYELTSEGETKEQKVVADHLVAHAGLALGVAKRLTLFATLPVHVLMEGQENLSVDAPPPDGAGLGDLMLGGRIGISGAPGSHFASALELFARLPTAELANDRQVYSGDAIGSYEPALIAEARGGRFDIRLRAGGRLRQKKSVGNLELGHELVAGLGMRVRLGERTYLSAECYASTFANDPFERTSTPAEALFGIKRQGEAWSFGVAAGPGLSRGYGSPDLRAVGMLGYWPQRRKPVDSDRDGLLDPHDGCPTAPEDKDAFEDQDGCPEPDNDEDGLPDGADTCKLDPEDTDDFEDSDGCPDLDDDHDGLLDAYDGCPREPEDKDGFEDSDGCPEPDNDLDSLLDAVDHCPSQAEDFDAFEDGDGCPEEAGGKVKLTCAKIEISEAVYFDSASDRIQKRSFELLDQVASVLKQAKHVLKVRIEGHTDARGNDAKNLELSKRRAASVLRYLEGSGIEPGRLESEGYGETQPLADDRTKQGRAQNRRVEFKVAGQSSQCAQQVTP